MKFKTVFSETFTGKNSLEDSPLYHSADSNETITVGTHHRRRCARVHLDKYENSHKHRTEMVVRRLPEPHFRRIGNAIIGKRYRYYFSLFIPCDFTPDIYPEIVCQWHSESDRELTESGLSDKAASPPLALMIGEHKGGGNVYQLMFRSTEDAVMKFNENRQPIYHVDEFYTLGSMLPDVGKWTSWMFDVLWDCHATGITRVYKNGKKLADIRHGNSYNDEFGPYWKLGIYKWDWAKANKPDGPITQRTYFYDSIKIKVPQEGL